LAYNSPIEAISGQDSILHMLKRFKSDSDKDFDTKVTTRLRDGGAQYAATKKDPGQSPSVDIVRVQAPDGSIRKIPKSQVQAALAAGGKLADQSSAIVNEE